jgi:hypothetical protein
VLPSRTPDKGGVSHAIHARGKHPLWAPLISRVFPLAGVQLLVGIKLLAYLNAEGL